MRHDRKLAPAGALRPHARSVACVALVVGLSMTTLIPSGAVAAAVRPAVSIAAADTQGRAPTPVMAAPRLNFNQLLAWFRARSPGGYQATVSVDALILYFLDEGNAQGVGGDLAFVQSILETSWFRFPDTGQVRPSDNNFSGLGAVDDGNGSQVARFATAQLGVRAQIQHLWAYADPDADADETARPLIDPRFDLVSPKGKAPTWEQMGNGNWATDPQYASKILTLYADLIEFSRIPIRNFVGALYQDFLGRAADESGLTYWTNQVDRNGRGAVALSIARQPEYIAKVVGDLYVRALGRQPDSDGLSYWVSRVRAGLSVTSVAVSLFGSAEAFAAAGGTNRSYVTALYRKVLFRDPDPAGADYWTDRLNRGASTRSQLARLLYQSDESRRYRVATLYMNLLDRGPDSAGLTYWAGQLATREDVALAASLAASTEYFQKAQ